MADFIALIGASLMIFGVYQTFGLGYACMIGGITLMALAFLVARRGVIGGSTNKSV